MENYIDIVVNKPWGWEYLLYQNKDVAIWHLFIEHGYQTSLHCHPNKKTGLIVLAGAAKVSFLTNYIEQTGGQKLFPKEKVMIRQGVFHSTQACVNNLDLLEIETPIDKQDLVRLEDKYGREGKPYENKNNFFERSQIDGFSDLSYGDNYHIRTNTYLQLCTLETKNSIKRIQKNIIIVIKGSLQSLDGFQVVGPGDVLYRQNFITMLNKFELNEPIDIIGIGT